MKFKCVYNEDDYFKFKCVCEGIQFEIFENGKPNYVILNHKDVDFFVDKLLEINKKGERNG